MFHYYQIAGGEEQWEPVPAGHLDKIRALQPMFVTVLAVSKLVADLSHEEKLKLAYAGPFYVDWDSKDEVLVIEKVNAFLDKLVDLGVDLEMCRLYATGGRGYHLEVPQDLFMDKIPKNGYIGLPAVYREMALKLCVDTLDLTVYSSGRGRMWRQPNVKRTNGRYKVPVTVQEMREMTPELNQALTSAPRDPLPVRSPELCVKLSVEFSACAQKVEELLKKRAKFKPDPALREKATSHSILYAMAGIGIKPGVGFHQLALQLASAAVTAGWTEERLVEECEGLINNHQSDGDRYNSPAKRREELARMHRYVSGNICYEFSIGAIKVLLDHPAVDLDGIAASKEEVQEVITESAAQREMEVTGEVQQDEYHDVARGITLNKHGVYMDTEFGKKRICSVSFANARVLMSCSDSQIIGYDSDILVNGARIGNQTLELDVFSGLVPFNRFASKYGHAFQGSDAQVRTVMMRFVEQSKKNRKVSYVVTREGLDIIQIGGHPQERLQLPFMVWADNNGVMLEPEAAATEVTLKFAGFPDPRGVFRSDIAKAPQLASWLQVPGNKPLLRETLHNMLTCQRPEVLGKLIGWYTACFWKQLFQKMYGKFPLLHVNGPAGLGKTELNIALASLFFYQNEARPLSPGSTNFAIVQHLTASSSIPLILDEYKPHEMRKERHDSLKALFRDAYNQRDVVRGGGSRDSDDYRSLQFTQLAAPLAFIAEAAEEEAAVMERVVLVTLARPPQSQGVKNYARFQAFQRHHQLLGILGQYLAGEVLNETTFDSFVTDFDEVYNAARKRFMLSEENLAAGLSDEELLERQNTKERPVFNHAVAMYGFRQFRKLVTAALGADAELDDLMTEMEDGVYARLADLHAATTPEYVKVLREIAAMSYTVDSERPEAIRRGTEYGLVQLGARSCIEIAVRTAYTHYRMYCRGAQINPLFGGAEAFAHAIQDSPAFIKKGTGEVLKMPGVYTFDVEELARLGVDLFKSN
jgi:hypothetical protein